jgi:hypothetical protein
MSEMAKTCLFAGVAVVALVAAVLSRPIPPPTNADGLVSMKTRNPVDDPLSAQELEINRWDSTLGDKLDFKVARVDGVWKIPSHGEYPADAERQMGDAATAATNLKPLGVASTKNADHELYGVIDPQSAEPGAKGVGTRLVMKNGKGETLVNTIIGKEVKGASGQRYVRQIGKDPVYIVKIDPSKLSTKFEDWIEKDLLKLNTLDIAKVVINDYAIRQADSPEGKVGVVDRKGEIILGWDDQKNTWSVDKLLKWNTEAQAMEPYEMPAGEELNTAKLNDMKGALDDLKIIDVQRKPAGLTADLKVAQDFVKNQKAILSLMQRGFYPVRGQGETIDFLSSEGDFIVEQKDGVEYVLRFGNIKLGGSDGDNAEEKEAKEGETKPEQKGENRFLFVAARFNPEMIEKPVKPAILEDEPSAEEPAAETPAEKSEGEKTEAAPAEGEATPKNEEAPPTDGEAAPKKEEAAPAEVDKTEEKSPAKKAPAAAPQADENASLTPDQQDGGAVDQPTPTPAAKKAAGEKKATAPAGEKKAAEPAAEEKAPAAEEKKEPAAEPEAKEPVKEAPAKEETAEEAPANEEPAKEEPAAEAPKAAPDDSTAKREAAELQYNREMDEYNEKVANAEKRVTELNNRFGDWYYVISDEVFQKIHLTSKDLFIPKAAEKKAGEETPKNSIPLDAPESIQE